MADKTIVPDPDVFLVTQDYTPDWQSLLRYQTLKRTESFVPSDEQQFEAYEAGHITAMLMESDRPNPLFRAPVGSHPQHILDIGTGKGSWPIDVADIFPSATVRGVDLYPPPVTWMPPNCILEVDDVLQEWTWQQPFDLIHMRIMDAAFTAEERERLYEQCYKNLRPGGWIEQLELSPEFMCDDGSLPSDSPAAHLGKLCIEAAEKSGRTMDLYHNCEKLIEKAGFTDVHVHECKWPLGPWARDKVLKEVGTVNLAHWSAGMEGYAMYLLTKYGEPQPWSKEEVMVYVAKVRKDLANPRHHVYHRAKRVWAQKPVSDAKEDTATPEIKTEQTD
ncbi:hypothetical protein N7462_004209 [Penicillium macrosclerotiorum]|uniref:uncharacterized protein n=1 Tax=Penicillium macrosclerotiorum TaxID=303699 RepID=UPI002547EA30|nr:uncharacterized protein N7462_004209 [Penicillium macrosclerotiorum]KAJ5689817.1 hypothetical protein N7462_004209 [Penicillium macrosclerotiorum]